MHLKQVFVIFQSYIKHMILRFYYFLNVEGQQTLPYIYDFDIWLYSSTFFHISVKTSMKPAYIFAFLPLFVTDIAIFTCSFNTITSY